MLKSPAVTTVERAGKSQRAGQQRRRDQKKAVKQDLPHGRGVAGDDRQHGHAGTGVVVATIESQRPEMRRRPQKDDQEQNDRCEPDVARRRGPTDHWRQCAGSAADDDVLRRAPLQPDRVDHDVEKDREGEQPGGQSVGHHRESGDGTTGQHESQTKRLDRRDPAARDRPPGGPAHEGIDIGIAPHVEHPGGTRAGGNGEHGKGRAQRIEFARRDQESDERREDGERHDAGFHQRNEVPCAAARRRKREPMCSPCREIARALGPTYPPDGGRSAVTTGERRVSSGCQSCFSAVPGSIASCAGR